MSKTARTDEIDEVITSVRQLVSKGNVADSVTETESDGVLLLTPETRIDSDVGQAEAPAAGPVTETDLDDSSEPAGLERTIADLEAAVNETAESVQKSVEEEVAESAFEILSKAEPGELIAGAASADNATSVVEAPENLMATNSAEAAATDNEEYDAELAAFIRDRIGVDEEMLRDMVAEIVREELSGVLGEKITRNVRKLVRREINRVLATRGLS